MVSPQPVGVIEAKKESATLTGVEWQTKRYLDGLSADSCTIGLGSWRS